MNATNERKEPIPKEWRAAVVGALEADDRARVIRRQVARNDWNSTFPYAWESQWDEAIIAGLTGETVLGRRVPDMVPRCDAYAFWFVFERTKLYGKIGLLPDGRVIIVFSSHKPRKGDEL
jgi:hypothetical protein